jgi:hypothetical protein
MSNKTWSDTKKNILYIVPGELELKDFQSFTNDIEKEAEKLTIGFNCINDLREFVTDWDKIEEEDVKNLKSIQKKLKKLGMKNAVRILGKQPAFVIDLFQDEDFTGYSVSHVNSFEEAEDILKQ